MLITLATSMMHVNFFFNLGPCTEQFTDFHGPQDDQHGIKESLYRAEGVGSLWGEDKIPSWARMLLCPDQFLK